MNGTHILVPRRFLWLLSILAAGVLGYVSTSPERLLLVGALVVGTLFAWLSVKYPPMTVLLFWVTYALRTTVLSGEVIPGLYYPLYLIMGFNSVARILRNRHDSALPSLAVRVFFSLFYVVVLVGLLWHPVGGSVDTIQRLFIYGMGVLTVLQLRTKRDYAVVIYGIGVVSVLVAIWTIIQAYSTGLSYRGGIDINENYVASLINIGLVGLLAQVVVGRRSLGRLPYISLWAAVGIGLYANALLASRGWSTALIMAFVVLVFRSTSVSKTAKFGILVTVGILCTLALALPGAEGLLDRWSFASQDGFGGRLPLWQATGELFGSASLLELFMGHGMGAASELVNSVNYSLTSMHNAYLQIAVDYGLVGVTAFILLVLKLVWSNSMSRSYLSPRNVALIALLIVGSLTTDVTDRFTFWIALATTNPLSNTHDSVDELVEGELR